MRYSIAKLKGVLLAGLGAVAMAMAQPVWGQALTVGSDGIVSLDGIRCLPAGPPLTATNDVAASEENVGEGTLLDLIGTWLRPGGFALPGRHNTR